MNELQIIDEGNVPIIENWEYDSSVEKVKSIIYKWNDLTNDVMIELWNARKNLKNQGARTYLTSGNITRS